MSRGSATIARRGKGLMRRFNEAGVLELADVHVAARLERLGGEKNEAVLLAIALAVRAVRHGSVCVPVAELAKVTSTDPELDVTQLPWPEPAAWSAALRASGLVQVDERESPGQDPHRLRPVRLLSTDGGELLYLDRYFRQELLIRESLNRRAQTHPQVDAAQLEAHLHRYFPGAAPDRQRLATAVAATHWTSVIAGGPGTGKTHTVARVLAVLFAEHGPKLRVALAAPTGKAAAQLQSAVALQAAELGLPTGLSAMTIHRLLGWVPDSQTRFARNASNPLPYDVVVIDETSMVSLTLMSRIVEAVRDDARLIFVGDPDQLTSVEAGAVLADLVARPDVGALNPDCARIVAADLAAGPGDSSGVSGAPAASEATGDATAASAVTRDLSAASAATGDGTGASAATSPSATGARDEYLSGAERLQLANGVVRLSRGRRFADSIADLARAVREGDDERAWALVNAGGASSFHHVEDIAELRADVIRSAATVRAAAERGDAGAALIALSSHRVLCAHRDGPAGVGHWSRLIRSWTAEAAAPGVPTSPGHGSAGLGVSYLADADLAYPGQPLLVTANDHEQQIYNGDTGVMVQVDGRLLAGFKRGDVPVLLHPNRLPAHQTGYAMTVHRSQGSQYDTVSVVLPDLAPGSGTVPGAQVSALLTRELLYTAITRAKHRVRVVGSEEAFRAGVRRQVVRASGLRLRPTGGSGPIDV